MSNMLSEKTIESIKKARKGFLWAAVIILIGEVLAGVVAILAQGFSVGMGRIMATFGLCALVLFLGVDNFTKIEKGNKAVQGFAFASLVLNAIWLVLAILLIWEVVPFMESCNRTDLSYLRSLYCHQTTVVAKLFFVGLNTAINCFLISNVLSIKETLKPVKPLKLTALMCELYCTFYFIVLTLMEDTTMLDARWAMLAGLAGFAFIVMALAAVIISRNGKKNEEKKAASSELDDADMQAKIHEMVEKEVQARLEAEKQKEVNIGQEEKVEQQENIGQGQE